MLKRGRSREQRSKYLKIIRWISGGSVTSTGFCPLTIFVSGGFESSMDAVRWSELLDLEFSRESSSSMDTNFVVGLPEMLEIIDGALLRCWELGGVVEIDIVSRQF
jgi:hypothetical protein